MKETTLKAFRTGGMDGAHWGLSDWYPEKEKALVRALKSDKPFDTGWYSSKKEIASGRISSVNGTVQVEVSVSDDFDTEGYGSATAKRDLESVREAIEQAWNEANSNQKDNRVYAGYALIHWSTKIPDWRRSPNVFPQETRKRYGKKQPQCLDYYIVNMGEFDSPPGDNYYHWGWQEDPDDESEMAGATCNPEFGVPRKTIEKFEDFAQSLKSGSLRIGDWELKAWDE